MREQQEEYLTKEDNRDACQLRSNSRAQQENIQKKCVFNKPVKCCLYIKLVVSSPLITIDWYSCRPAR